MMNFKTDRDRHRGLVAARDFVLGAGRRHSAAGLQGQSARSWPTTTGPASTSASTPATAGARRTGRAPAVSQQARRAGWSAARSATTTRSARSSGASKATIDWADIKGSGACARGFDLRDQEHLARHRPRPLGYAFDRWLPYFTGGAAFGNVKANGTDPARDRRERHPDRLDRRRRPRIRLPRQLDGQDRISLRRSRQLRLPACSRRLVANNVELQGPTSSAPA